MKDWLKKRSKEPTTYLGISQLIIALGYLFKINEAPSIADAVAAASGHLSSGDYITGGVAILGGLGGLLLKEKGNK